MYEFSSFSIKALWIVYFQSVHCTRPQAGQVQYKNGSLMMINKSCFNLSCWNIICPKSNVSNAFQTLVESDKLNSVAESLSKRPGEMSITPVNRYYRPCTSLMMPCCKSYAKFPSYLHRITCKMILDERM